ncbi:MAG: preprotein translocase subunit SecG, partial [Sandaracinaceae bacterium]
MVLLQQGKGGGMGAALGGGGGSNTVFGGAGAGNFLTRLTAIAATLFMVLSALLAYMSTSGERSMNVIDEVVAEQTADSVGAAEEGDSEGASGEDDAADDAADDVPLTTEEVIEGEADDALDAL